MGEQKKRESALGDGGVGWSVAPRGQEPGGARASAAAGALGGRQLVGEAARGRVGGTRQGSWPARAASCCSTARRTRSHSFLFEDFLI